MEQLDGCMALITDLLNWNHGTAGWLPMITDLVNWNHGQAGFKASDPRKGFKKGCKSMRKKYTHLNIVNLEPYSKLI